MYTGDYLSLAWLLSCWFLYGFVADHTRIRHYSMSSYMQGYRIQWTKMMLKREHRIVDAGLQGNLLQGVAFFASTSIFAVGGTLALLGSSDAALGALSHLPLVNPGNLNQWTVKVVTLTIIFIYAFFKFAWAFRLFNYGSAMIGAAPMPPVDEDTADAYAHKVGRINNLGAQQFNRGIRAYFFALATLAWWVNSWLFIGAVALVILVLIGREFGVRKTMEEGDAQFQSRQLADKESLNKP